MKWKALVAELANRINQPHVIDIYMRKVYKAGIEEGKRKATIPEKEAAVMEGWVARDNGGFISLFSHRPDRVIKEDLGFWGREDGSNEIDLPRYSFPSVTWQSEPKKVRLIIEEIEE